MDLKKLFNLILIIGGLVLIFGTAQLLIYQPKQFNQKESKKSVFGGNDDLGNWMNVQSENQSRKEKRKGASRIMLIGGIIIVAGGILRFSTNSQTAPVKTPENNKVKEDIQYCTFCGNKLNQNNECINCRN